MILLASCAPSNASGASNESSAKPKPSASKPAAEMPADIAAIINNPDRVSPADISSMPAAELADFAAITYEEAPGPEKYAPMFVTVYDAWMNSGATPEELKPYEDSAKNIYEDAMAEKYDPVFVGGLFGISDVDGFRTVHHSVLNQYRVGHGLSDIPYSVGTALDGVEVLSDSGTSNGFKIIVKLKIASNQKSAGIDEIVPGTKDKLDSSALELTVGSIDGVYKIMSAEKVSG
ncbi:hypothetical protein M4D51_13035 [Microbacterium sp. p3-SID338]|uniref:hypothetical protein n=1 Tax=Microbacterium sp. p3-SID338 TaxID=2916214 RepID=UPI0021A7A965|nr:hypothetical protein [Microbacterium sp. p3-SID338]MCT1396649.1 hypothetical protein [Microbacterium sp. p3-SID338]